MSETNPFGGGNANSIYVPMSLDEQEVLDRLVTTNDLVVNVLGWGIVNQPRVTFGDLRLQIKWRQTFDLSDGKPRKIKALDLELRTRAGALLFKERQSTTYGNEGVMVFDTSFLDLVWDIAIQKIDPEFVKAVKPGAIGLTTAEGNRKMRAEERLALSILRQRESGIRSHTAARAAKDSKPDS